MKKVFSQCEGSNPVPTLRLGWALCCGLFATAIFCVLPSFAFAAVNDTTIGNPLCRGAGWMTGNLGKGMATISVGAVALKAMQGTVTWGMVALVGAGIAIIFSAAPIVHAIKPSADMTYCNSSYALAYLRVTRAVRVYDPFTGTMVLRRAPGRIIPYWRRTSY